MEESSIIFKKNLCVTSLSSGTRQSSSKEPLNRFRGRRHQSAVEKRQFISGHHSAQTPTAEDAPACHIYKYRLKSIKSDFNRALWPRSPVCIILLQMINLPERRASSKVCEKNKDFLGQTNLEPGSCGSQLRRRNHLFHFVFIRKPFWKSPMIMLEGKGETIHECLFDMSHALIIYQRSFILLSIYTRFQEEIGLFPRGLVN